MTHGRGPRALLRAAQFLYNRAHWPAEGDDEWQPWLIDKRYGTSFHGSAPARTGKNFGFTDWLYGPGSAPAGGTPVPATPPPTPTAARPQHRRRHARRARHQARRPVRRRARVRRHVAESTPTRGPAARRAADPDGPAHTDIGGHADIGRDADIGRHADNGSDADRRRRPDADGHDGVRADTDTDPHGAAGRDAATDQRADAKAGPTPPPADERSDEAPKVTRPVVLLSTTSVVPRSGVPVIVDWALASTEAGLRGYQLQVRVDDGDWVALGLTSPTSSSARRTLPSGHEVRFRVRAVDRTGHVGDWRSSEWFVATALSDSSRPIRWAG